MMKLILKLFIAILTTLLHSARGFSFASITVDADSKIINTITRYKFTFDRTQDDNLQATAYSSVAILPSDTATVTFPNTYTLSTVSCSVSINGGTPFTPTSCAVSGFKVIVSGIVTSSTYVANLILWVSNILNPSPAFVTDYFYGTIGSDVSGVGSYASSMVLQPGTFSSCYITFNPNIVNSTSDMILTIVPANPISPAGSIRVQFPASRRWTNDLSTTNNLPLSASMSCSNKSSNVKSTFVCAGDSTAGVVASNLFASTVATSFSFSINNFLSPPTEQPSDPIVITSSVSGAQIDTCTTYVSNLVPKIMPSIVISSSTGAAIIVNKQYLLRFTFTLADTIAQTDTIILNFPPGSNLVFSTSTVTSNFGVYPLSATYDSNTMNLNLFMQNQARTFPAGSSLILTIGTYTAPPSIEPTPTFTLTFFQNGYKKMVGTTTLTASPNTISGTAAMTTTSVNSVTSCTFTVVTTDALSSAGKIKIVMPSSITIATSSASCATLTGTGSGLALTAICTYNSAQNSVTLSSLNSTASIISAQTITIIMSGLKNPPSTAPTGVFNIFTYYKATDASLVASGSIPGVTATTAIIALNQVAVNASSYIVNDQVVSYSVQLTVSNPIAAGGYIMIYIPGQVSVNPTAISGQCSINVNSTSYVSTVCTAATPNATGVMVNFTNPFIVDMTIGTIFVLRISSIFTNPSSTRPTSSFGLYTYHPNGYYIANVDSGITAQMTTPDSFQSITVTRASQKNYDLTTYTFTLRQKSQFESSSVILITFPSSISTSSPACSLILPTLATLSCSYLSPTLKIVLPSSTIVSNTVISFTVTNTRNPPSFAPAGSFGFISKTSGEAFQYSLGASTSSLLNNIATAFQSVTYLFTPNTYGDGGSLKISFDPSDSGVIPSYLRVTLANSFTVQTLTCNSFVDFIGSCTSPIPNTIQVSGTFTSSLMTFSVTGFTNPLAAVTDFSSVISFDSNWFKLDESTNIIKFAVSCAMPCKTCDSTNTSICNSCYLNTAITTYVLYDSVLKACYETCVDGKYANSTSSLCLSCDSNCLTCTGNATFCLKCNSASIYKYLLINTTTFTQRCVSQCPATMYPESSLSPVTCKPCVAPCRQCTSSLNCLSCVNGTYFYQNQCLTSCPTGIAVPNAGTSNCDFCDPNCLTCVDTTTKCTSCNTSLLLYQNVCRVSCASPLVPQNGTCGPCDISCKTCSNNPYNCTSCDTSSSLPYLLNNLCLSGCPQTYYRNIGAGICSLCSSVANLNCNNCSSVSTCYTCNSGFVFFQQNCLNYTPIGYVNISGIAVSCTGDCLYCSISPGNCTSCQTLNYYNFQCLINCPSGYIASAKVCQPCLSPCRTCSVTVDNCTSCLTTLSPQVYLSNNFCLEQCPAGSYPTQTNYTCQPCRSPCEYCSSVTSCTTCLTNFYLSGSSCLTVCPSGYTGVDRVCQICLGNCATCTDTTTKCTSCKPDTYFMSSNFSCVATCGTGLFIDYLNRACVACTVPCKTCVNSTDTCLSCTTGILYNSQCLTQCPEKYFVQSNVCNLCPGNCSSCISLVNCTSCAQSFVLYNGFCIVQCPPTNAVVINSVCTKCSTPDCHKCTSADFCTNCDSNYSLYNGACLSECPSGFQTNGTNCLDTNQVTLTTSASFPVPFSIASVVVIIACLMSKLQFGHTFVSGAIYSLLSICQVGSLAYFLYMYFMQFYFTVPLPFIVGLAAIGYMYLLNLLALIIQNCSLCYDRDFANWLSARSHKLVVVFVNIIGFLICHKFRNILFSKLFNLDIFTAKLDSTSKFKVMNVFSFLSLLHSGAAIFAAVVAVISAEHSTQLFYACIDVIVVTSVNVIFSFFNVLKPKDYFYEKTTDGFELKKRINVDDDFYQSKIQPGGKAVEDQQGFPSNLYRTQAGNGLTNELLKVRQSGSDDRDYSFGSLMQKNVQQVSVQAVEQLTQKQRDQNNNQFSIVMATSTGKSAFLQSQKNQAQAAQQQRVYNQEVNKNKESPSKRTVFYKEQPQQMYSKSDGQSLPEFSKKVSKAERSKKKVFDSSGQDNKSEQSKNILYKPDFKRSSYIKPAQEEQNKSNSQIQESSAKDAAVGSYRPVQFVEQQRVDQNIQAGSFGNRDYLPFQSQQKLLSKNVIIQEEQQHEQVKKLQSNKGKQNIQQDSILPVENIRQYEKQLQGRIKNKKEQIEKMKSKIQAKQKANSMFSQENSGEIAEAGRLYRRGVPLQTDKSREKDNQNAKIMEKIQVFNQQGQKRTINVQFNNQVSQRTYDVLDEQIIEDHQEELIFNESNLPEEFDNKYQEQEPAHKSKILVPEVNQVMINQNHNQITEADNSSKLPTPSFELSRPKVQENINLDQLQKRIVRKNQQEDQSQLPNQNLVQVNPTSNLSQLNNKSQRKQSAQIQNNNNVKQRYENKKESLVFDGSSSSPIRPYATIDAVPKKNTVHNPPKSKNRFQYENEDKNISESGEDEFVFKRTQFAAPFQTDKQETEFHSSAIRSPNVTMIPRSRVVTATQRSNAHSLDLASKSKQKRSPTKQELQFGPNDRQEQPYIEQSEPDSYYHKKESQLMDAMMERPDNDDLKNYYQKQGRRKSRDKSKRKPSQSQLHAEKIYLQRQEVGKKWK